MLKLGYAQADITPTEPMELVGFYRPDNVSKGVQSPLIAQVSVWEDVERCCLITVDSLGFMKDMTDFLRERVGEVLGVSKDKVMVCFSHTHSAPNADSEKQYFEMICDKVSTAVGRAMADLKTISVGHGNAEVEIGVNRRPEGYKVDKRAGFLLSRDEKTQKNRLLLVRLTAHGNVLKADNYRTSPDCFGAVRETLQEQYGCPVMVLQGASGNIAPKYFSIGNWCLCGVPYELMTEFALGGVERMGNEFFYINGYANGCLSYFPMAEEFDKGGYEVYWSMLIYYKYFHRVFPFERESGERLLDFMVENASQNC